MKNDTHPEYHPVIFKDGEHEIVTRSTATSKITREVDGVEHYVVNVDISAYTHPFYTGQKKLIDSEGRVDRFRKRYNMQEDDEEGADADEADDASADADEQTDESDDADDGEEE
jgi:large subunit ribosomal protein L31